MISCGLSDFSQFFQTQVFTDFGYCRPPKGETPQEVQKTKSGQEEEIQEDLDVTLRNGQDRRPAQWLSPATVGLPLPALSLPLTSLGAHTSARTPGLFGVPGLHRVSCGAQEEKCSASVGVSICTGRRGWGLLSGALREFWFIISNHPWRLHSSGQRLSHLRPPVFSFLLSWLQSM